VFVSDRLIGEPDSCDVFVSDRLIGEPDSCDVFVSDRLIGQPESCDVCVSDQLIGQLVSCDVFVSDRLIGQPESRARGHNRPQQVLAVAGHYVADVSVGSEHTLALTCDGQVWAWGSNNDGQLGVGHTVAVREPQLVAGFTHNLIKQVTHDLT